MMVRYYCVEDVKAEQFGPLFPAKNDEVAKRMFKQILRDVDPQYYGDYFLHFVFVFSDSDGAVLLDDDVEREPICSGFVFMEVKK